MDDHTTRRRLLRGGAVLGTVTLAGCTGDDAPEDAVADDDGTGGSSDDGGTQGTDAGETDDDTTEEDDDTEARVERPDYEVWAFDQGTDTGYVYLGDEEGRLELDAEVDLGAVTDADDHLTPHMVDFNSTHEYAAVACTTGARTLVFRTADREIVAEIETGAGTHFAGFTPNDGCIHVDVIGEEKLVRIDADLDSETFSYDSELVVAEDPVYADRAEEFESSSPICHDYDGNGYSYHTLGPGIDGAGVVVVDVERFAIEAVFAPDEIRANCGTLADPDRDRLFLTGGAPSNHEETGGVSEWYVLDTNTRAPIDHDGAVVEGEIDREAVAREFEGADAHGFWLTDDELFVVNRETDDGVVVDPDTLEVVAEVDDYGTAPDILWGTPADEFLFATLRGPEPRSGDPHAATGETPGFSVFDPSAREVVDVVEPAPDDPDSDFHGIGGRPL